MAIETFKMEDVNAIAAENRRAAYTQEADPMFMQVQRGEITKDVWEAKIQEIKDRFPYVTDDLELDIPEIVDDPVQDIDGAI